MYREDAWAAGNRAGEGGADAHPCAVKKLLRVAAVDRRDHAFAVVQREPHVHVPRAVQILEFNLERAPCTDDFDVPGPAVRVHAFRARVRRYGHIGPANGTDLVALLVGEIKIELPQRIGLRGDEHGSRPPS
ncbi:MAG: hypothetical protein ABI247_05635 [Rhodanobacter sp.]